MEAVTYSETKESTKESGAYKKVFWRIIPFLTICYIIAYLDRVNVGFAKLQMAKELGFSDAVYGLGAGIFFLGYFIFEVPSNLILHRIGARIWIARIMITWGLVSGAFIFVNSEWMYYILRFLLGVAEAGFYPGVILYLTYWYPSNRRAKMVAIFQAGNPVSGIFGNPLSGWIMDHFDKTGGLEGWQWMFVLEAIPAVVIGVITVLYLDNGIRSAKWLNEDEKKILEANIAAEIADKPQNPHSLALVFRNGSVWFMCLIYFFFVMGQYGLTLWMPTLVKASGVSGNFNIGLVSAIPFICAMIAMIAFGQSADRHRERRWHLVIPATMGVIGFVVAATVTNGPIAIAFLSLAAAGVITCAPLFWSLPTAFLSGTAAAAGIAIINSVGNLAGFASPFLIGVLRDVTGSGQIGMYMLAATLAAGAVCVLCTDPKVVNR